LVNGTAAVIWSWWLLRENIHPLELKEGNQVSCSTRRVSGRLRVCSWRTGTPLIYLAIDSQRIDLTWASGYDGPEEPFCIHAVFNSIIFIYRR
jgi:hypothetical protein